MEKEKNEKNDYSIKIILLGNETVGKTALIKAYNDKEFSDESIATVGADSFSKTLTINEKEYTIQLWDTAGQEKFRSVSKIYFKGSDIVIFVYDITKETSFHDLEEFWIGYVKDYLKDDIVFGIAANKMDLFDKMEVENEKGKKLAEDNGALFCGTSAKDDPKGFQTFVNQLVNKHISKINNIPKEQNINLKKSVKKKKKKRCC